jgi:hypothetical protein
VAERTVGLLHPGEMGAAVGAVLRGRGLGARWASEGRSAETRGRAKAAGLEDVGSVAALADCDVILSICPPHAALDVARSVGRFGGLYVDANAVAPATAREVAEIVRSAGGRFVDGGFTLPEAKSRMQWKDLNEVYVGTDFGPGSMTTSGYPRIAKEWKRGTSLSTARTVYECKPDDISVTAYRDHTPGFERDFGRFVRRTRGVECVVRLRRRCLDRFDARRLLRSLPRLGEERLRALRLPGVRE